jgi:hypothetical protein
MTAGVAQSHGRLLPARVFPINWPTTSRPSKSQRCVSTSCFRATERDPVGRGGMADMTYPEGWPRCKCGDYALDGHLTCGRVECDEGAVRDERTTAFRAASDREEG